MRSTKISSKAYPPCLLAHPTVRHPFPFLIRQIALTSAPPQTHNRSSRFSVSLIIASFAHLYHSDIAQMQLYVCPRRPDLRGAIFSVLVAAIQDRISRLRLSRTLRHRLQSSARRVRFHTIRLRCNKAIRPGFGQAMTRLHTHWRNALPWMGRRTLLGLRDSRRRIFADLSLPQSRSGSGMALSSR